MSCTNFEKPENSRCCKIRKQTDLRAQLCEKRIGVQAHKRTKGTPPNPGNRKNRTKRIRLQKPFTCTCSFSRTRRHLIYTHTQMSTGTCTCLLSDIHTCAYTTLASMHIYKCLHAHAYAYFQICIPVHILRYIGICPRRGSSLLGAGPSGHLIVPWPVLGSTLCRGFGSRDQGVDVGFLVARINGRSSWQGTSYTSMRSASTIDPLTPWA